MTGRIDVERELDHWLTEGPRVVSDRVIDAALTEIDTTPQRVAGLRPPWRILPMSRLTLAAAIGGVFVLAFAVGWLARPVDQGVGGPSLPPAASAPATPAPSPAPTEVPTVTPAAVTRPDAVGTLVGGVTYRASALPYPFEFTIPVDFPGTRSPLVGDILPSGRALGLSADMDTVTLHEHDPLPTDLCSGFSPPPVPFLNDPVAIETWLRGNPEVTVSAPATLTVDGRLTVRWDVRLSASCDAALVRSVLGNGTFMNAGRMFRVYAIPSPKGTVLATVWPDPYAGNPSRLYASVDQLVQSIRFP